MFDVDNLSARDDHNVAGLQLDFELAAVNGVFQRISRDRPCNCLNASPLLGRIFICHHHAIGVDHSLKFVCEIHGRKLYAQLVGASNGDLDVEVRKNAKWLIASERLPIGSLFLQVG